VQNCEDGIRLVAKINSNVSEEEIYEIFSRIYRRYKILNQKTVGNYFFKEMEDLVNKLCDDFAETVRNVI
jgi:type I restriction enzyme R subunit